MNVDKPQLVEELDPSAVGRCGDVLTAGGVVIVATETVYGLAVLPDERDAVAKLRAIKARPDGQRFPIAVSKLEHLGLTGAIVPPPAQRHIQKYWPGPLTIALGLDPGRRPGWVENDALEAAFRSPDSDFLLQVIDMVGPLFLTSANRHGQPPPKSVAELDPQVTKDVALIVDGGVVDGVPSTLVNYNLATPRVEREGPIELLLGQGE